MAEVIQPARLAVALARGVDQRQVARRAAAALGLRCEKTIFERNRDAFGEADAHEAASRHRVAVVNQAHRLGRADDLVGTCRVGRRRVRWVEVHGVSPAALRRHHQRKANASAIGADTVSRRCGRARSSFPRRAARRRAAR